MTKYSITYTYPRMTRALAPIVATSLPMAEMMISDLQEHGADNITVTEVAA